MSRSVKAVERWAILILFAGGFLLVALDQWFHLDPSPPVEENRYLAKLPHLANAVSVTAFRTDFERYYRDHLGFRDFMIRTNSRLRIGLGATRVTSGEATVYIGKDDWLYYGYTMRDYMGTQRLDSVQLAWWQDALARRRGLCEENGAHYLFFLAPVKVSIYPEHLPRSVRRGAGALALDQLIQQVGGGPDSTVLDLRPVLRGAKSWHLLYWRTDHHWTPAGAGAAFEAITRRIRRWFPDEPVAVKDELVCEEKWEDGPDSLARTIGLSDAYPELRHRMRPPGWDDVSYTETRDESTGNRIWSSESNLHGLRAVVVGDSFTLSLLPYYVSYFSYVRFVDHLGVDYDPEVLLRIVEQERPDVVLEERTGWALLEVPSQ